MNFIIDYQKTYKTIREIILNSEIENWKKSIINYNPITQEITLDSFIKEFDVSKNGTSLFCMIMLTNYPDFREMSNTTIRKYCLSITDRIIKILNLYLIFEME